MAWYSYTLALGVPMQDLPLVNHREDLTHHYAGGSIFVYSSSRNGALLGQLEEILRQFPAYSGFYLLCDFVKLAGVQIAEACGQLSGLLGDMAAHPERVSEAYKSPHSPTLLLQAEGCQPLLAEYVYPENALIQDGYYYAYSPAQVCEALETGWELTDAVLEAQDPDGESLEYLIAFLRSHLKLLQQLLLQDEGLVYGELNA